MAAGFDDETMLERRGRRDDAGLWSSTSANGVVVTSHYRATAAGVEVLSRGGNAFDAAAGASLALGVVEPGGSGLGGMGVATLYSRARGRALVLSGACRAPRRATPEEVARSPRYTGYRAVAVPTYPAMLGALLDRFGTLSCEHVFAPAIRLAEEGFRLTRLGRRLVVRYHDDLLDGNAARVLLDSELRPLPPGTVIRQRELAATLRRLVAAGLDDFYTGAIGRTILRDMERNGAFLGADDFREPPRPVEREPLLGRFGSWDVRTAPPPYGGTALLEMLHLYDALAPGELAADDPATSAQLAAIIRRTRRDRRRYRLGPAGKEEPPDLTSLEYARRVAAELRDEASTGETTHLNVMDRHGNTVAMTQSIERTFGAKVGTPGLGFTYNGYLRTFKVVNRRHPYYLRPGAEARSNAAPTLALENGEPRVAVGSTGSERMLSGIFEVLVGLRHGSPFEAVRAPRLHCTPRGVVFLEKARFPAASLDALRKAGFRLRSLGPWSFQTGGLTLATFDGTLFRGVADPRRDGAAGAPGVEWQSADEGEA